MSELFLDDQILASDGASDDFEALLVYLKRTRGFDFSGYKRSSLQRRVEKQMQSVGVESFGSYLDYLEVHPEEFAALFNTVLINVTSFFRDEVVWDYLSQEILPIIITSHAGNEPIRIWSAGCATGQEPYSLAITLAEKIGIAEFRDRVKIYATDLDDAALQEARAATYSARDVQAIPPHLLEKYFEREGSRFAFHSELRRSLIFGRHDLLQDAPISRIDLLICRNTLMYFNSEMQARILGRFHFAINDGGFLFLGKAEMLFSHSGLFLPLDLKRRVFVKVTKGGLRDRLMLMAQAHPEQMEWSLDNQIRLRDAVFEVSPVAQIIVDIHGILAMVNERARALFRVSSRDTGRPLQDLELSYRPIELRSLIEQAYAERHSISVKDVSWTSGDKPYIYDVFLVPLQDDGILLGISVSFTDVTRPRQLMEELKDANRELQTAQEVLQSTSEELETTNEELHSTVEELETTNEELQSTNEELETTNAELQSTNGELQAINSELRDRSSELNLVNAFLESILTSLQGGVIVLDRELNVQIWNSRAQDLWGLRQEEVQGKPFRLLDIGLPVGDLLPAIEACLNNGALTQEVSSTARNRRGKSIVCKVNITPLSDVGDAVHGVILLMEEQDI